MNVSSRATSEHGYPETAIRKIGEEQVDEGVG